MSLRPAVITGVGSYVPDRVLTNADLEKIVETSDEWIVSHTGIRERRIASDEQASSDLGAEASLAAIEDAGLTPADIDYVICPTITPDQLFPCTANTIQAAIGVPNSAGAFDVLSGCTGFIYGLQIARQFVATGAMGAVLVVAAEKLTSITNWTDRSTCVLFGDGAGAAVVQPGEGDAGSGVLSTVLESYGEYGYLLDVPAGGSRQPLTQEALAANEHCLRMNGPELYKIAVRGVPEVAEKAISKAGLTNADIDWVIMHQANMRIIEAGARRLDIPEDRLVVNIDRLGNTSGASIAIALDEAYRDERIQTGDNVLLVGFGAGFSLGAAVLRWEK